MKFQYDTPQRHFGTAESTIFNADKRSGKNLGSVIKLPRSIMLTMRKKEFYKMTPEHFFELQQYTKKMKLSCSSMKRLKEAKS